MNAYEACRAGRSLTVSWHVSPLLQPPEWAGELGESLVRQSAEQAQVGIDADAFRGVDPLAVFSEYFGSGDRFIKPRFDPSFDRFHPRRVRVFTPSHGKRRLKIDRERYADEIRIAITSDGIRTEVFRVADMQGRNYEDFLPMRDFARRLSQQNKPVATWLHTMGYHVAAESHHERTLMTIADFHPAVHFISGQPFTILWPKGAAQESHTPDGMVIGPFGRRVIVDIRTPAEAMDPEWVAKVPAITEVVHAMEMDYVIWTGMSRPYRRNLENFTEARVPFASYDAWSGVARALCDEPMTACELAWRLDASGYGYLWALTLIRRMLWCGALLTDMFTPYGKSSIVRRNNA